MAGIQEVELRIDMALADTNQELRQRLAAALWRNRQLARENRTLAATGQQFLRDDMQARINELTEENATLRAQIRAMKRLEASKK